MCAVLCGSAPLFIALVLHTVTTDTFYPNGPTKTFNDFTPSDRTGAPEKYAGKVVRPITASPVYLLFVPRHINKKIEITLVARPEKKLSVFTAIQMGYRTGRGPETNITTAVTPAPFRNDGWMEWTQSFDMAKFFVEERGARRIVFVFPPSADTRWLVREVRLRYY